MTKPATSPFQTILVFDTTLRDQTTVALVRQGKVKILAAPVRAQDLQRLTTELLTSQKLTIDQIDAVAVLNGPGSYTGVRIGIAAANTLGWLAHKPIIELNGDNIDQALKSLLDHHPKTTRQAEARY